VIVRGPQVEIVMQIGGTFNAGNIQQVRQRSRVHGTSRPSRRSTNPVTRPSVER
jgi:hypothetical protein